MGERRIIQPDVILNSQRKIIGTIKCEALEYLVVLDVANPLIAYCASNISVIQREMLFHS